MDRLPPDISAAELRVAYVIFNEAISDRELSCFRGAIIHRSAGNTLFHNHEGEGYRYRYPRIQYKIIDGRPAVMGINEGAKALMAMFPDGEPMVFTLGGREIDFHIAYRGEMTGAIEVTDRLYRYQINNWLPLNNRNFSDFRNADGLAEQITMLEKILTGNILSLAKGLGIFLKSRIVCRIVDLSFKGATTYKGVELMTFSAVFRCNVTLPQWIGLGKSSSINHGTITILS